MIVRLTDIFMKKHHVSLISISSTWSKNKIDEKRVWPNEVYRYYTFYLMSNLVNGRRRLWQWQFWHNKRSSIISSAFSAERIEKVRSGDFDIQKESSYHLIVYCLLHCDCSTKLIHRLITKLLFLRIEYATRWEVDVKEYASIFDSVSRDAFCASCHFCLFPFYCFLGCTTADGVSTA